LIFLIFTFLQIDLYRPLNLQDVVVTNNYVYVAPLEHHQIYQMDLEGNLLRVIGRKGEGPGEFDFVNIVGNRGDQIIAVSVRRRSSPFEFSAEGKLVAEHRLPEDLPTNWVYKTAYGWLFLEADEQWVRFFQTEESLAKSRVLLSEPKVFQEKDFKYNKIFWKLSRDGKTFFLVRNKATELFIVDLGKGTTTTIPLDISPIPDPNSESGFFGKTEHLPLVTDLVAGPAGTCLVYSGEHLIHQDLKPKVIESNGTVSSRSFSAESWRRLIEIRGSWAWVTVFDEEAGAVIRKLEVDEVDNFTAAHPIVFSVEARKEYMRNSLKRSLN